MQRKTNSNDFGVFLNLLADSNWNFVVAKIIFFGRFEFLVCSKFNHMQCGRTCACAVACLHPHNSISNVVVSLTIHDNFVYIKYEKKYICFFNVKLLWKII